MKSPQQAGLASNKNTVSPTMANATSQLEMVATQKLEARARLLEIKYQKDEQERSHQLKLKELELRKEEQTARLRQQEQQLRMNELMIKLLSPQAQR